MTESTTPAIAGSGRRPLRRAGIMLGGTVGALAALYGVSLAVTGSDIPRGTQVLGIDLGGRSVPAAQARLAETVPRVLPQELSVVVDERRVTRTATDLGLGVDSEATVARARDGWASPWRSIPALFGAGREVAPVPAVDPQALAAGVAAISETVGVDAVDGALTFDTGVPVAVRPVVGWGLDLPATEAALVRGYFAGEDEVAAALIETSPAVSAEEVDRALADLGWRAMAGPVTITVAQESVELEPERFGRFLSTEPDNSTLRLVVDAEGLVDSLEGELTNLGRDPRDARFQIDGDEISVVPGRPGVSLNVDILAEELADTLLGEGPRTVDAGARTEDPEFTTEDAKALGITERLSTFRTEYPVSAYRITNIGRAAELINGSIVEPGEVWSLNETVGERTVKNGFVRGTIIRQGQFVEDLGGGVSQSATTTFNAAFFAGVKLVEYYPHSLYLSRYPAGREATVAFGQKDLRFENDSGRGIYIQAEHAPGYIEVSMWGTKVWDEVRSVSSPQRNFTAPATVESTDAGCEPQSPVNGFDITVTRIFERDGEEVERESFDTHYDPTDRIVCVDAENVEDVEDEAGGESVESAPARLPEPAAPPG